MSLAELVKLVPPPNQPFEIGTMDRWREIEAELGTSLPADYREFVFAYGTGLFANFYRVDNPFSGSKYMGLVPASRRAGDILRDLRECEENNYVAISIFPEPGGLLHWADDENGNCYYWRTDGQPDEWTIVEDQVRGDGFKEHSCSTTEFLFGILSGNITPLAGEYPNDACFVFKPMGGPWDGE